MVSTPEGPVFALPQLIVALGLTSVVVWPHIRRGHHVDPSQAVQNWSSTIGGNRCTPTIASTLIAIPCQQLSKAFVELGDLSPRVIAMMTAPGRPRQREK
jgi:hypothetical protein